MWRASLLSGVALRARLRVKVERIGGGGTVLSLCIDHATTPIDSDPRFQLLRLFRASYTGNKQMVGHPYSWAGEARNVPHRGRRALPLGDVREARPSSTLGCGARSRNANSGAGDTPHALGQKGPLFSQQLQSFFAPFFPTPIFFVTSFRSGAS